MKFKPFIIIKKNKEKLIDCRGKKKMFTLCCRVNPDGRFGILANSKFTWYVLLFILNKGAKFVVKNTYGKNTILKIAYRKDAK